MNIRNTLVVFIILCMSCSHQPDKNTEQKTKMMKEKVLYVELTPREFRKKLSEAPVAYLPLGTLEWHGEHLPLGSDGIQPYHFFQEVAAEAGGIVLPMLSAYSPGDFKSPGE